MRNVVGCDVSKAWIDAELVGPSGSSRLRVENKAQKLDRFARELPAGSLVGMEATGELHERLADTLFEHGHTVYVVNPRWIHLYGRGVGLRGKTDRTDAALIARFIAAEASKLHPYKPPSAMHRELRKLLRQRGKAVRLKAAAQQSLGNSARSLISEFNNLIKALERRIADLIKSDPECSDLTRRLRTQPGVGPIVSAYLAEVLTRIPFRKADASIAHTGLDPRSNDSGQKQGRRFLSHHGDAALRSMLFLSAMCTIKHPGAWRALYQDKLDRGLPSTAALVVVARKLARIAYGLFRSGGIYDPTRLADPKSACVAT